MHKSARDRKAVEGWGKGKAIAFGMRQRDGKVRATVVPNTRQHTVHGQIDKNIERGATLYTDAHSSYRGLDDVYGHQVIDHAEAYVDGRVHTNGIENFWSLLKRGLHGTYVSVEAFHLFRYLDERVFTYNLRDLDDYGRFSAVLRSVAGRRLTYAQLTGNA
jgi:transposase-like protein